MSEVTNNKNRRSNELKPSLNFIEVSLLPHKLLKGPFFHNLPQVKHQNLIRIFNSVDSMRYSQAGLSLHESIQGGLHFLFICAV